MSALCFHRAEDAIAFCKAMNHQYCVDISCQSYKANCRPVAISKLPLITTKPMIDILIGLMAQALQQMEV